MKIDRIDRALEVCRNHLEETKSFNTEIDSLLAGIVLVIAYAECELYVKGTIEDRLTVDVDKIFRGMLSSQLAELFNEMGNDYKDAFKHKTNEQQRAESYYNNIITNRHNVAHRSGTNVTFREVERFYTEGNIVLDFFTETALSIPPAGSQN